MSRGAWTAFGRAADGPARRSDRARGRAGLGGPLPCAGAARHPERQQADGRARCHTAPRDARNPPR
eukprot:4440802-Prymnesium_polylepis.1